MSHHLTIADQFGSVDVRNKLSKSYVHIRGQRLQPLCRKLKIKYAQALVDFEERGRNARFGWSPKFDGVVVASKSANKLFQAIEERNKRTAARPVVTEEVKRQRRERKQQRDAARFVEAILERFPLIPKEEANEIAEHTCTIGSGRVGRSGVVTVYEAVELAVRAHVRHNHTDYESILYDSSEGYMSFEERQEIRRDARKQVAEKIDEVVESWSSIEVTK